jgi:hypothetical protein
VYIFDCETVDRKVESLTIYCADFGIAVWKIKWSMWSANGAEGSGIFMANDCDPSCAEGGFLEVPVNVYLSDLTTDGKNYFLNTATIVPSDLENQKGPIVGEDGTPYFTVTTKVKGKEVSAEVWDIASFYREVPNMRTKRLWVERYAHGNWLKFPLNIASTNSPIALLNAVTSSSPGSGK